MQAFNVFENGIGYLAQCLNLYMSGCAFLLLYVLGIMYLLVKGSEEERKIFLPSAVLLVVTVYNPVAPMILNKIFDVSSEYYRFFWIAPVVILVPLVVTKLIKEAASDKERKVVISFLVIAGLFSGYFLYDTGIDIADNIYKMPDELVEISGIIHGDSDKEYNKAYFEYDYNMEIRQYDPKMLLTIDREEYLYAVAYSYTEDMINDENTPTNAILALLTRNQKVSADVFINALENTKTEYVVLTKGHPQTGFVTKAGLELIGETATHNIFKYNVQEPSQYELVDYSEVEHKFSPRRLK